jgi:hypothetical protein
MLTQLKVSKALCMLLYKHALPVVWLCYVAAVQELALPHILSGKDVVLAAETGSGKTLAYIAPLASKLLERASKRAAALTAAAAAAAAAAADGNGSSVR